MAMLVNRNSSRLECLYYILQSAHAKFDTKLEFEMKDLKYDEEDEHNVHEYCGLLKEGFIKHCPFLENQFDSSKCYATRSIEHDFTKRKNIIDVILTYERLGFIVATKERKYKITTEGENWIKSEFGTNEWQDIIDAAILSYGPFVGLLYQVKFSEEELVSTNEFHVGYPNTVEVVEVETEEGLIDVTLSVGSKNDSVTRTRSKLFSFGYTSGYWTSPKSDEMSTELPHIKNREMLNQSRLNIRKVKVTNLVDKITDKKLYVNNPLSYNHLLKNVKSLRENGIEHIRQATMKATPKVINRRFLIVDILNRISKEDNIISLEKLYSLFEEIGDELFIEKDKTKWLHIFQSELEIAFLVGLPFEIIEKDNELVINPLTIINENELREGAPEDSIKMSEALWAKVVAKCL